MSDKICAAKVADTVGWINTDVTKYIFKIVYKYNGLAFSFFSFVLFKTSIDYVSRKTLKISFSKVRRE